MSPLMALKTNAFYFCYSAAEGIVLSPIALGLKFRNDFISTSFHDGLFSGIFTHWV